MPAYYNEIDPGAAAWLRELIRGGHIADGVVDTRSITDVSPDELDGFTQCHFFAGIGVWSYALRLAGWPDDRPVWTGSCPCQPFSDAGKGAGFADERHLWPSWHWLIAQRRPDVIFGEQVASKDGLAWLDLVCTDLEATDYAAGAVDLCAAGVGAPHIRQRFWLFAKRLAHAHGERQPRRSQRDERPEQSGQQTPCGHDAGGCRVHGGLGDASGSRCSDGEVSRAGGKDESERAEAHERRASGLLEPQRASPLGGLWADAEWIACRDGKARPVKPGTFPLVDGAPAHVGRLRGYGNAIVAQAAAEVIGSFLDVERGIA